MVEDREKIAKRIVSEHTVPRQAFQYISEAIGDIHASMMSAPYEQPFVVGRAEDFKDATTGMVQQRKLMNSLRSFRQGMVGDTPSETHFKLNGIMAVLEGLHGATARASITKLHVRYIDQVLAQLDTPDMAWQPSSRKQMEAYAELLQGVQEDIGTAKAENEPLRTALASWGPVLAKFHHVVTQAAQKKSITVADHARILLASRGVFEKMNLDLQGLEKLSLSGADISVLRHAKNAKEMLDADFSELFSGNAMAEQCRKLDVLTLQLKHDDGSAVCDAHGMPVVVTLRNDLTKSASTPFSIAGFILGAIGGRGIADNRRFSDAYVSTLETLVSTTQEIGERLGVIQNAVVEAAPTESNREKLLSDAGLNCAAADWQNLKKILTQNIHEISLTTTITKLAEGQTQPKLDAALLRLLKAARVEVPQGDALQLISHYHYHGVNRALMTRLEEIKPTVPAAQCEAIEAMQQELAVWENELFPDTLGGKPLKTEGALPYFFQESPAHEALPRGVQKRYQASVDAMHEKTQALGIDDTALNKLFGLIEHGTQHHGAARNKGRDAA